jgi:flagellar biosynthetic protein FlhB
MEPRSQRTERPTPRRLKKAREQGQVARSREVPAALGLLAFLVFGHTLGPAWLEQLQSMTVGLLSRCGTTVLTPDSLSGLMHGTATATAMLLAMPVGCLALAGLAGNLVQGPLNFTLKPLAPRADKLNPVQGLRRIFTLRQGVEVLKGLLKILLFGAVAYAAARRTVLRHPLGLWDVEGTFATLVGLSATVLLHCGVLAVGLAILDLLFRHYDHHQGLRMTKREVRDEHKETEGHPLIRAKVRQKQLALARSRMMADVPRATVVVTNPEHVAVALRYVAGETAAPKLVAKGRAFLAARIRAIAAEHRVPIVSDPPLARALYRSVPVGAEIPPALFRAVAEILALVLKRERRPAAAAGAEEPGS